MTSPQYLPIHKKVKRLLDNGSLHEAFALLRDNITSNSSPLISDKLNKLEETYKYMIHYLVEGYADNSREEMLSGLINDLHSINDSILRSKIMTDSPDI